MFEVRRVISMGMDSPRRDKPAGAAPLETRLKAAVQDQPVPAELRVLVRERLRAQRHRAWWMPSLNRWVLAAAGIAVCFGLWSVYPSERMPALSDRAGQDTYIQKISVDLASVLRPGLADHIHCSVFRKYPANPPSLEEMEAKLGPEFKGILPATKSAVPEGYRIVMAHHCGYAGRKYTHVTLRKGDSLISLVIVRKLDGESFDALAPALQISGIGVYQSAAGRYQVAGFDAGESLVFVVSDLKAAANLEIAANLAGTVNGMLRM